MSKFQFEEEEKKMNQPINSNHWSDAYGNPAGGCTHGTGFCISWQNGPLQRGEKRKAPNGAFVEGIIKAAMDRLQYYQGSKFKCQQNQHAIEYLQAALTQCQERTLNREKRDVEGTHQQ